MMARKRKRKAPMLQPAELPTPEQLRNGDFARDFVTHAETNTKVMTHRRRDSTILERWLTEDDAGKLFPIQAQRFIGDCISLWRRVGSQRVTANYGERIASGRYDGGMSAKEALDELHRFRLLLGPYQRHYWGVYENVVRHNEPAGVAGSQYAKNPLQRIQSAKLIVSMVACDLAGRLRY